MERLRNSVAVSATPLADELLGRETALALARCLERAAGTRAPYVREAAERLAGETMSRRVRLLRDAILEQLPSEWAAFRLLIEEALAQPALDGWMTWPLGEAVAVRALEDADPPELDEGLELLAALTPRLTSEFALRPFIEHDPERTLEVARRWAQSDDEHVRRLASEGTRPNLPWGRRVAALDDQPGSTVPILDHLYRDSSETVRRSVANHLNDLSRLDRELALSVAARWHAKPDEQTRRLLSRALRTLIKRGDAEALALLGFADAEALRVTGPEPDRGQVGFGGELRFEWRVRNDGGERARVAIDYVVHFAKANGERTPKTFKLAVRELDPGEEASGSKRHSFRELTTRKHHPGPHLFELQVNGVRSGATEVELLAPEPTA